MDLWIRMGLLGAWVAFGLAGWLWWRRRHHSKHYPYPERAAAINEALKQNADLGMIYWSRTAKEFQRRVVTPLELDGYSLKAFDHTTEQTRVFKITRIRSIQVVPHGSATVPGRLPIAGSVWTLAGLGAVGLTLLGIALYHGLNQNETDVARPAISVAATVTTTQTVMEIAPAQPIEIWEVVVDKHPKYDTNQVARLIRNSTGCAPAAAERFVAEVVSAGHATVWRGEWAKAEGIRQELEGDDVDARLQRVASQN